MTPSFSKLNIKLAAVVPFFSKPAFTGATCMLDMFLKHFFIPVKGLYSLYSVRGIELPL